MSQSHQKATLIVAFVIALALGVLVFPDDIGARIVQCEIKIDAHLTAQLKDGVSQEMANVILSKENELVRQCMRARGYVFADVANLSCWPSNGMPSHLDDKCYRAYSWATKFKRIE